MQIFLKLIACYYNIEVATKTEPEPIMEPVIEFEIEPEPIIEPEITIETVDSITPINEDVEIGAYPRHLYLKTNGIGWIMLVTNIAVELDIAPHWSATMPIYYSGFNYFKHTLKFRTFTVQPEMRWWSQHGSQGNHGFFAGAHFGLGYFNYAVDGKYRVQDHDGRNPAIGGGLAVGYRMHLCRRWRLEFSIGAGVYHARYDKYENDYGGQRFANDKHRTWVGIDQASVSLVYAIPIKKGGKK